MTPISIDMDRNFGSHDDPSWASNSRAGKDDQISSIRVLIVDDNWFARSMMRNVLQALGIWKLVECPDPKEGLRRLQEEQFDLVLLDNDMPGLSGVEFTELVRASGEMDDPEIPIVMITSRTELGQVSKAVDAGIHEFLAKPFTADGLLKKIISAINTPRQFVRTKIYVGPCRRRQKLPIKIRGKERRARVALELAA